jgi:hypothetical protein
MQEGSLIFAKSPRKDHELPESDMKYEPEPTSGDKPGWAQGRPAFSGLQGREDIL